MENNVYFEVGKTYTCAIWGEVECITINDEQYEYPICCKIVKEDKLIKTYTYDGRYYEGGRIVLSQKPLPEIVNEPIKEWRFKVGDFVEHTVLGRGLVTEIDNKLVRIIFINNSDWYCPGSAFYNELKKLNVC